MTKGRSLSARVIIGSAWTTGGRIGVRLIGLVSTVILARLLTPADFGLVAMATSVYAILTSISDFGFNSALIRFQDATDEDFATAWTLNVLRGLLLALIMIAGAYPLAAIMSEPALATIILVLAIVPLIDGFENVRFITLEKGLDFRPGFTVMVITKLVSFATIVGIVLIYQTYWAMIGGIVMLSLVRMILWYMIVPYRPHYSLQSVRKLFGFSGWLMGANLFATLTWRMDSFILRAVLNLNVTGLFFMAREVTVGSFHEIIGPVRRVLFPTFSGFSDDPERFRALYIESTQILGAVLVPVAIGLALVTQDIVPLLFGPKWVDMIFAMQVFAALPALNIFLVNVASMVLASGQTKLIFMRNLALLPMRPALLLIGALWGGFDGAVYGAIAGAVASTALELMLVRRITDLGILRQIGICRRSQVAALAMTGFVLVLQYVLPAAPIDEGSLIRLVLTILVGSISYILAHFLLWILEGRPQGAESRLAGLLAR